MPYPFDLYDDPFRPRPPGFRFVFDEEDPLMPSLPAVQAPATGGVPPPAAPSLPAFDLGAYTATRPVYDAERARRARLATLISSGVGVAAGLFGGGKVNPIMALAAGAAAGGANELKTMEAEYAERALTYQQGLADLIEERSERQRDVYTEQMQERRNDADNVAQAERERLAEEGRMERARLDREEAMAREQRMTEQFRATEERLTGQFEATQERLDRDFRYDVGQDRLDRAEDREERRYDRGVDTFDALGDVHALRTSAVTATNAYNTALRDAQRLRDDPDATPQQLRTARTRLERARTAAEAARAAYDGRRAAYEQTFSSAGSGSAWGWANAAGLPVSSRYRPRPGTHVENSRHYDVLPNGDPSAVDIDTAGMSDAEAERIMADARAQGFRVLDERRDPGHGKWTAPHIHLESRVEVNSTPQADPARPAPPVEEQPAPTPGTTGRGTLPPPVRGGYGYDLPLRTPTLGATPPQARQPTAPAPPDVQRMVGGLTQEAQERGMDVFDLLDSLLESGQISPELFETLDRTLAP